VSLHDESFCSGTTGSEATAQLRISAASGQLLSRMCLSALVEIQLKNSMKAMELQEITMQALSEGRRFVLNESFKQLM
jgi:hypothetical protein